ncbi:MAG: GGDEF domain-containing protein [Desulfuromonadia bacterium]
MAAAAAVEGQAKGKVVMGATLIAGGERCGSVGVLESREEEVWIMIDGMTAVTSEKLLDSLFDGVYFVDRDRRIVYWNSGAERITGYKREKVIGRSCADNILRHIDSQGKELCIDGCPLVDTIRDGVLRETSVFLHHRLGHRVPVSVRTSPVRDEEGTIIGAVEIFSDNSNAYQIMKEYEQLKHDVYVDTLTGAGNRRYGEMALHSRVYDMEHFGITFGLLFIDIDHFKGINDTYGHAAGDDLLITVARSIGVSLRKVDIVARWGGEEFLVILPVATEEMVKRVAERIRILVENSSIDQGGGRLRVTVSIGATISRPDDTWETIVGRADSLMYESKRGGRNRVTAG